MAWAGADSSALDPFSVGINLNLTGDEPPERIQTAFAADGYDRPGRSSEPTIRTASSAQNQSPLRNKAKASEQ